MAKDILHEIAPLEEGDALYIADRHKNYFDYPIHSHDVFELNFVAGLKASTAWWATQARPSATTTSC